MKGEKVLLMDSKGADSRECEEILKAQGKKVVCHHVKGIDGETNEPYEIYFQQGKMIKSATPRCLKLGIKTVAIGLKKSDLEKDHLKSFCSKSKKAWEGLAKYYGIKVIYPIYNK